MFRRENLVELQFKFLNKKVRFPYMYWDYGGKYKLKVRGLIIPIENKGRDSPLPPLS